jgi:hypothetical protein
MSQRETGQIDTGQIDTGPTTAPVSPGDQISFLRVLRDQRKVTWVAVVLVVASYWILVQLGEWTLAGCIAGGILLGLVNHLVTEFWLLRTMAAGRQLTRKALAFSTMSRLVVLTVIAVAIAASFWPDGIGLLFGLAIFRLIALVMTTIPLLKELKSQ